MPISDGRLRTSDAQRKEQVMKCDLPRTVGGQTFIEVQNYWLEGNTTTRLTSGHSVVLSLSSVPNEPRSAGITRRLTGVPQLKEDKRLFSKIHSNGLIALKQRKQGEF